MTRYILNKSFQCRTARSERVLAVAEAFGLGLEDREFRVLDNVEIDVNPGDVVFITGQSGSGKSQLLRMLQQQMQESGLTVADIESVKFEDCALIDQIGENMTDAIGLLARAGINDAYLLIRKPQELSDGQRYRFRLAKMFEQRADVWVADEFGAVLDRTTAKTVAFNAQKLARAGNHILMVATTHDDMVKELGPNVMVTKHYNDRIQIVRSQETEDAQ